jgi:hypothetical protein
MKTTAERIHKRNPHTHSHRPKPAAKSHIRQGGVSGENEFLPELPKAKGQYHSPREKASPEFLGNK